MFTAADIDRIVGIINHHYTMMVFTSLGEEALSEVDRLTLESYGIDIEAMKQDYPPYMKMFLLGRLAAVLSDKQIQQLDQQDFDKYIDRGQFIPLSERERFEYQISREMTYNHLKGLANKVVGETRDIILEQNKQQIISEEITQGVKDRLSVSQIVSNLGHRTGEWDRDWKRIVVTEMQNIYNQGKASEITRKYTDEALVWKQVYNQACRHCIKLYTTDGIGSEPRVFKLKDLIANGNNIGLKVAEWKPIVGSTHPHCFDDQTEVLTNNGFKFFKDLDKSEQFLSVDLSTGEGEYVYATHWIDQEYNGSMIHRHHKNIDMITSPNHTHVIRTNANKKWRLVDEDLLPIASQFLTYIPQWTGKDELIEFDGITFNTLDFCEFMGFYISEGSHINYKGEWRIQIAQSKEKHYEDIADVCQRIFGRVTRSKNYLQVTGLTKFPELWQFLNLGHSHEKFIPSLIRNLPPIYLEKFLDAFRKGDGSIIRGRQWGGYQCKDSRVFYTSSKILADHLGELILKIGKRPSFTTREVETIYDPKREQSYTQKHPMIIVNELTSQSCSLSHTQLDVVDYSGRIYDVTLEKNHTLVVRRKGKVWISGNCRCDLRVTFRGQVWDAVEHTFKYISDRVGKVIRLSKIKITVGDKEFLV